MPRRRESLFMEMPVLPFLTIMLGLMSVMALTTMGVSVEKRRQERNEKLVELVGIPGNFIPLVMRSRSDRLEYLDDARKWHAVPLSSFLDLHRPESLQFAGAGVDERLRNFTQFLIQKVYQNRQLSHSGKQHTVIMWVDSDGITTQLLGENYIEQLQLPIRIGLLPILPHEEVTVDGQR